MSPDIIKCPLGSKLALTEYRWLRTMESHTQGNMNLQAFFHGSPPNANEKDGWQREPQIKKQRLSDQIQNMAQLICFYKKLTLIQRDK